MQSRLASTGAYFSKRGDAPEQMSKRSGLVRSLLTTNIMTGGAALSADWAKAAGCSALLPPNTQL